MSRYSYNYAYNYDTTLHLTDSFSYIYSGGKSGYIPTSFWMQALSKLSLSIELNIMMPEMHCDSVYVYRTDTGKVKPFRINVQHINANKNIDTISRYNVVSGPPVYAGRDTFVYNGNTMLEYRSRPTNRLYKYTYNPNGSLDTMYNLLSGGFSKYVYDVNNNLTSVKNIYSSNSYTETDYLYSNGVLTQDSVTFTVNSTTIIEMKHIYSYDAAWNLASQITQKWNNLTTDWDNYDQRYFEYDANHVLTSEMYAAWHNKWDTSELYSFYYNWFGLTDSIVSKSWYNGSWQQLGNDSLAIQSDQTFKFYYEPYFPTTVSSVKEKNNSSLMLYPVPASDILIIRTDNTPSKPFRVAIFDMQGRIVRQWEEQPQATTYTRTIPVPDLSPGNYVIKLSGTDIDLARQFSISR
ncbi:MAG: T9SS type A sorting domain-containing protein [Bacteroidetes bacterium]|nr:T9SS type A sorting domain-containing protein [Bacteroidota bacterium]